MPDIDMMVFLPEILHGLFEILADPALQRNCQSTLDSFLETIKKNPQSTRYHEKRQASNQAAITLLSRKQALVHNRVVRFSKVQE